MVVYCIDSCSASQAQRRLEKAFGKMHYASTVARKRVVEATPQFSVVKKIDSHQSHTLDGVRLPGRTSENRHAFFLLNNYLGGPSMNSCLNRELRDKRGYVYSVDSFVGMMSDVGQFAVYFACDSERIRACRRILRRELTRLAESPMKPVSFAKIKRQYLGQLKVSADRRDHQAVAMGKSLLYYGEVHDIDYASARIEEVTAEKMQQAAQYILNAGISGISMI
jgi:predicted Zn-dependent peptidase